MHNYKGLEDDTTAEPTAPIDDAIPLLKSLNRLDTTQIEACILCAFSCLTLFICMINQLYMFAPQAACPAPANLNVCAAGTMDPDEESRIAHNTYMRFYRSFKRNLDNIMPTYVQTIMLTCTIACLIYEQQPATQKVIAHKLCWMQPPRSATVPWPAPFGKIGSDQLISQLVYVTKTGTSWGSSMKIGYPVVRTG